MSVKSVALRGIAWTSLSYGLRHVMLMAVSILIARLLLPAEFGVVALALAVVAAFSVFRDIGLATALVRLPSVSPLLLSSTFWATVAGGILLSLALVFAAPLAADAFDEPRLARVLPLFAPTFLLTAASQVHSALLQRARRYRSFAIRETASVAIGGAVGLAMAHLGYGVYSLVGQQVVGSLVSTVALWVAVDWRPQAVFAWSEVRGLFAFGVPLMGSIALDFLALNLDSILIGGTLGVAALGLYTMARGMVQAPVATVQKVLGRVMFPEFSRIQHDPPLARAVYLGSLRYIAAVLWLPLGGFLVLAPVVIPWLLGAQWLPAVFLSQVFCAVAIGQVLGTTVGWLYLSHGKTRLQFWVGLVYNLAIYAGFVVGLSWGLRGMVISYFVVNYSLGLFANRLAWDLVGLRIRDVLAAVRGPSAALAVMAGGLLVLRELLQPAWSPATVVALGALLGTVLYAATLWLADAPLVRGLAAAARGR